MMKARVWLIVGVVSAGAWVAWSGTARDPELGLRSAVPGVTQECGELRSVEFGRYCIARQAGSPSPDVLYYFHGLNDDEKFWLKEVGAPLYARWRSRGVPAPTVVSLSIHRYRWGNFWLLSERNRGSDVSGDLERIAERAMPEVEQMLGHVRGRRLLMGASMGGFNAAQLYLKYGARFSRVALVCPAVTIVSPFASKLDLWAYYWRTSASWYNVLGAVQLVKRVFPTEADYFREAPLTLIDTQLSARSAPLHVSCGADDEYGFDEGSREFVRRAELRGVQAVYQELPVGTRHGVPNGAAVADFFYR